MDSELMKLYFEKLDKNEEAIIALMQAQLVQMKTMELSQTQLLEKMKVNNGHDKDNYMKIIMTLLTLIAGLLTAIGLNVAGVINL